MSVLIYCILTCSIIVSTVTSVPRLLRSEVLTLGEQCKARGYAGACMRHQRIDNELGCLNLACAHLMPTGFYVQVDTGAFDDGTRCAPNKVCDSGVCVHGNMENLPIRVGKHAHFTCRKSSRILATSGTTSRTLIPKSKNANKPKSRVFPLY